MLRATYYAQELFSTFGPTIGEIALIPATGLFLVFFFDLSLSRARECIHFIHDILELRERMMTNLTDVL